MYLSFDKAVEGEEEEDGGGEHGFSFANENCLIWAYI